MLCKVFFACVQFFAEVVMLQVKTNFLSLILLSMLSFSTGVFALDYPDCTDYESVPDEDKGLCKYYRIWDDRGAQLWVVPPGENPFNKAAAIKGATFYVYAPNEKGLGRDSLTLELADSKLPKEDAILKNLTAVKADDETGLVNVRIGSRYELNNFPLGTSDDAAGSDPKVSLIYNFYVPYLKYYVEGKEITSKSQMSYEVGDTMHVDVEAIIPIGRAKGRVDSALQRTFYITAEGQSESMMFLSEGGKNLKLSDGTIRLDIKDGKGKFMVVSTKAISDGSTFTMNAFPDSLNNNEFILKNPFPGEYQFTNPDMPTLDSAAIFDTDGDGIGDSIATWFGGKMDSVSVDSFYYSWPNDDSFEKYSGDVKQKKDMYGLPDVKVELQKDSATGAVKAFVCTTVGNRCETLQTALADSIGAAIQEATLIKGNTGSATDTLLVRFNKDMDTSWTTGRGLKLNGSSIDVTAFMKDGNLWAFVVDTGIVRVGDMLKIETVCGAECPDGILTAADGVPTNKNNQEVPVQNAGRVLVDNENNGFYDRDGDGRMDSASVGFETPITEEDLKNMDITFYWLDGDGELLAIKPNLADLTISADGRVLGYALDNPEKYDVKEMLTGIDKSYSKGGKIEYGYATISNKLSVNGKDTTESADYNMRDYMPPVISSTFLQPESFQEMEPDKFKVTFSEAMDYKNATLSDDCLAFYVDGQWVHYNLSSAEWSDNGRTVTLFMEAGEDLSSRMNPADSVRFDNFTSGLADTKGNKVSEMAPTVLVEGDPRLIMKTNSFADLNKAAELSERAKPFTIEHVKNAKEASDQSSLGVLMDVAFSTIMSKDDSVGASVPNMDKIGLTWELYVYTNLGAYVGGASGNIDCNDPFFEGNCLENPDKLYVRWNMRSDNGRRVGAGIYLAKFKIKVYGAKDDFKVERIFRWGISSRKH